MQPWKGLLRSLYLPHLCVSLLDLIQFFLIAHISFSTVIAQAAASILIAKWLGPRSIILGLPIQSFFLSFFFSALRYLGSHACKGSTAISVRIGS